MYAKEYSYHGVKHRDLQDNIGIGYRYYGTIRTDRQWINKCHYVIDRTCCYLCLYRPVSDKRTVWIDGKDN